jgi:hypothetical protein
VRLVAEDRLAWVGHKTGTAGILRILVKLDEVRPLVRLLAGGLTPADAVDELRVEKGRSITPLP